jgi:hypothetical protein
MGWKNVKDHYRIGHMVCVTSEGICIGSAYIHNLIVISLEGNVIKRYDERSNEELRRYQAELDADPALLRKLVSTADTFAQSLRVFTYDDGLVLEKQCEAVGWPHVTHDGCQQHDNTYFAERAAAERAARQDAELHIRFKRQLIGQREEEIIAARATIARLEANLAQLPAAVPAGAGEKVDTSTVPDATVVSRLEAPEDTPDGAAQAPRE